MRHSEASQTQAFTLFRWPRALQLVHPAANTSLELRSAFHGVLVVTMKVDSLGKLERVWSLVHLAMLLGQNGDHDVDT